jgi:hypothetical protein
MRRFSGWLLLSASVAVGAACARAASPEPIDETFDDEGFLPVDGEGEGEGEDAGEGEGEDAGEGEGEGEGSARWDPSVGDVDCAAAWGQAGEGLSRCDTTKDDYVVVHKSARNMALCHEGIIVENFSKGLGFSPEGDKEQQGDGRTPEGVFYVPRLVPGSSYHKGLLISYPDVDDADHGLASGIIGPLTRRSVRIAQEACTEPPQDTALGGLVEIHGGGGGEDWTAGCMAVADDEGDRVFSALDVGDTVVVLP